MRSIPISDVYSQIFNVTLSRQYCTIAIYQKATGLYCDISVNGKLLAAGVICQNLNRLIRDRYLGFAGDFIFKDTQGVSDPTSPGLGSRYLLYYLEPADVARL